MEQTFMKEKNILQLVLSMSLPMVISMAVNSLYNIIDSYFVAKLSWFFPGNGYCRSSICYGNRTVHYPHSIPAVLFLLPYTDTFKMETYEF